MLYFHLDPHLGVMPTNDPVHGGHSCASDADATAYYRHISIGGHVAIVDGQLHLHDSYGHVRHAIALTAVA